MVINDWNPTQEKTREKEAFKHEVSRPAGSHGERPKDKLAR